MAGTLLIVIFLMTSLATPRTISVFLKPFEKPATNDAKRNDSAVSVPPELAQLFVPSHQLPCQLRTPPSLRQPSSSATTHDPKSATKRVGHADRPDIFSSSVLREVEEPPREETNPKIEKISTENTYLSFEKDYEIKSSMLNSESVGVVGRLRRCKQYWFDNFNPPTFVKGILNHGYVIPFKSLPPKAYLKNNKSSLNHPDFVVKAIKKLLETGSIKEHFSPPYVVNPLTVSEGKKLRLVLDLRHVNQFTHVNKFKYEGIRTLADTFSRNFYFFTFDLESGYHHIDIFEPHQMFLGFSWKFGECTRYFTFSVLPFGLNTASHCFTKMLRPLVTRWRSMGHSAILYIDDGISGHADRVSALAASQIVQKDLALSGLKVSESKSFFIPQQSGQWLGLLIDTVSMQFTLPEKKMQKLQDSISHLLTAPTQIVPVREIARTAGFIISAFEAIGPLTRLFTRHMYRTIESRESWSSRVLLSAGTKAELEFWHKNLASVNGQPIKPLISATSAIYSDASDSGYGGFSVQFNDSICSSLWSESEQKESSTNRELRAILYVLRSIGPKLSGNKLKWYSDSQNACRIISVGTFLCMN